MDDMDWTKLTPGHLSFNIWTINAFAAAGDAASLYTSIEWDRIKLPIIEEYHLKGCVVLVNSWEKKNITFCLEDEDKPLVKILIDTFTQFIKCRKGIRPTDPVLEEIPCDKRPPPPPGQCVGPLCGTPPPGEPGQ